MPTSNCESQFVFESYTQAETPFSKVLSSIESTSSRAEGEKPERTMAKRRDGSAPKEEKGIRMSRQEGPDMDTEGITWLVLAAAEQSDLS